MIGVTGSRAIFLVFLRFQEGHKVSNEKNIDGPNCIVSSCSMSDFFHQHYEGNIFHVLYYRMWKNILSLLELNRYNEKFQILNGQDPYDISSKELSKDPKDLPSLTYTSSAGWRWHLFMRVKKW